MGRCGGKEESLHGWGIGYWEFVGCSKTLLAKWLSHFSVRLTVCGIRSFRSPSTDVLVC